MLAAMCCQPATNTTVDARSPATSPTSPAHGFEGLSTVGICAEVCDRSLCPGESSSPRRSAWAVEFRPSGDAIRLTLAAARTESARAAFFGSQLWRARRHLPTSVLRDMFSKVSGVAEVRVR
jgi:hypothetical protein